MRYGLLVQWPDASLSMTEGDHAGMGLPRTLSD